MLLPPDILFSRASTPNAVFRVPVVLLAMALKPMATVLLALCFFSAFAPSAVFLTWVVIA